MAADNVTAIEQQEGRPQADYAQVAAIYQDGLGALLASGQAMINGCQTMHGSALAFLQSRAKESLAAGQRLAQCGSPQNALEIQLDFTRESVQAYAAQFVRWSELANDALRASLEPLQRRAATVSDRARGLAG